MFLAGGTAGGSVITITGTGFASSGNKVTIDGSVCDISAESITSITCETEAHKGTIKAPVTVDVPGKGYSTTVSKIIIDGFVNIISAV